MRNFLSLFFCLVFINSYSQKYELGKVTIEELKETSHPLESKAPAAMLFQKGRSYFEFSQNEGLTLHTDVEVKIKIYSKDGYEWANREVAYYVGGNNDENVSFSKAITYNLVGGKIEKTKLESSGEFVEKVNKYWNQKKITMPAVKEGSIIEYKFTIKTPYISNLYNWQFQTSIPVNYSEYVTEIPEFYEYNNYYRGSLAPKVYSETKQRTETIVTRTRTNASFRSSKGASSKPEYDEIKFDTKITKLTLSDIPALEEESYSSNVRNYQSSIEYELMSIQYKNQPYEMIASSWEDVVKGIYESNDFGGELKKDNYFEKDLSMILSKSNTELEKINSIFYFVQNKIKWNGFKSIYTDVGVKKAYADGLGNVAEINLILVAMLRKAGIEANPILLTTRDKPFNLYPSKTAFNYVICGIEVENDILFLDATDQFSTINVLPLRAMNYIGRVVRNNGSSAEVKIADKNHAKDAVIVNANLKDNGSVLGVYKSKFTDRAAYTFRSKFGKTSKETLIESLEKEFNDIEINELNIQNQNDHSQSLFNEFSFISNKDGEIVDSKIYINPLLWLGVKENPFKSETRNYPVDFIYPFHKSYTISWVIPDNYTFDQLPQNLIVSLSDNLGKFSYISSVSNKNMCQIVVNYNINSPIVDEKKYDEVKEFFNQIALKLAEKIVVSKIK